MIEIEPLILHPIAFFKIYYCWSTDYLQKGPSYALNLLVVDREINKTMHISYYKYNQLHKTH